MRFFKRQVTGIGPGLALDDLQYQRRPAPCRPTLMQTPLINGDDQAVVRCLLPNSLGAFGGLLPVVDTGEALVVGDAILLPTGIRIAKPVNEALNGTIDFLDCGGDGTAAASLDNAVESAGAGKRSYGDLRAGNSP